MPAAGGPAQRVTEGNWLDWTPVWSPDGGHLYFSSDRSGSMNLWRAPLRERSGKVLGPPEPVTTASPYAGFPSISRDGRRIAYAQVSRSINLRAVGFDPLRQTALRGPVPVTQLAWEAQWPDISPDGKWLVFNSIGKQEDLFLIRTDGTALRRLTEDRYLDRAGRWSPDGQRIAFHSNRGGERQIWIMNPDGGGLKQLTSAPGYIMFPVWSPTGSRLAYSVDGGTSFVMDPGKTWKEQSPGALPPLGESHSSFRAFSWSADGRQLAGHQVKGEGVFAGILVYSFGSRKFERLTDFGSYPRWLSDNRRLLFRHDDKLYLVDTRTKRIREVLSVAPHLVGSGLALSRDDRVIYFPLWVTEADIWLMNLPR